MSTFTKKIYKTLFEFMHNIFTTNSQILKMILFKASIINAQKHLTLFTLNVNFMSSLFCGALPTFTTLGMSHWPVGSALTVNIGFCFSLPKSSESSNKPLAKFHPETQLGSCNFPATFKCQLVVWWLLHTNVGIHNHKNYHKPQQIFPLFFFFDMLYMEYCMRN